PSGRYKSREIHLSPAQYTAETPNPGRLMEKSMYRSINQMRRNRYTSCRSPNFCEPLERRLMFITTTVDGTAAADTIVLQVGSGDIIVTVNGTTDTRSDTFFNDIQINGLGGNDTITIHQTGNNTV